MADYRTLKAELALPAYAGLSDAAAADALNAPIAAERALQSVDLAALWARPRQAQAWTSVLGRARLAADKAANSDALRGRGATVLALIEHNGLGEFNPAAATQRDALLAFLDQLVLDAIMTAAERTATIAALAVATSAAERIGWPPVTAADVAHARSI